MCDKCTPDDQRDEQTRAEDYERCVDALLILLRYVPPSKRSGGEWAEAVDDGSES